MQYRYWILLSAMLGILNACQSARVQSFADPALASENIHSIAVFPLRNSRVALTTSMEIDRKFSMELHRRDPSLKIIGPSEAVSAVNSAGLANELAIFLVNYDTSGVPDQVFLKKLGAAIHADAMIQGRVVGLGQSDGGFYVQGVTRVSIRYDMMGANSGRLLWDSVADAAVDTAGTLSYSAPPMDDAIELAVGKILRTLPFGQPEPEESTPNPIGNRGMHR